MKACELLVELQKLVDSGHGEKKLYVSDELIVTDVYLIPGIESNSYGIELSTDYSNKEC